MLSWSGLFPGLLCMRFFVFFVFFFKLGTFGLAANHAGSQFPKQGSNLSPCHWKLGVLTTGPPGKALSLLLDGE